MSTSDTSTNDDDDIKRIVANANALHAELSSIISDMDNDDFWSEPYQGESDKYKE